MRSDRRLWWVTAAAAVGLAAAGGSSVGLGAPTGLAGAIAAVSALLAAILVDRLFHSKDDRAVAERRRAEVLDPLAAGVTSGRQINKYDQTNVLSLLRPENSPVPFRGRRLELIRLEQWCNDQSACPVLLIAGGAGVGKTRLALEFARRVSDTWTSEWLHAGAGATVINAVRAAGVPTVVLVDDADGRNDLPALLDDLAEHQQSPAIRVVLVARSAVGLTRSLALQLDSRHEWIVTGASQLNLEPQGNSQDRERWFTEAITAFASTLGVAVPASSSLPQASEAAIDEPTLDLHARALLAVLDVSTGQSDPRLLSFDRIAEALIKHEKRRWYATAAEWMWGDGGPPALVLQERSIVTLVLLGPTSNTEAEQVLRRIAELRDASAERLASIASWVSALYPPDPDSGGPWIRPDMIGEWFVTSQLIAQPELAQNLREGMTDAQAARALAFLARAADRMESASRLFSDFAGGDPRREVLAAAQAALIGRPGRSLLDNVVAERISSAGGWTLDQLAELDALIPANFLPNTRVVIAELAIIHYRALAKDDSVNHQADFATSLGNLSRNLGQIGRYQDALSAADESVRLWRALVKATPTAHKGDLAKALQELGTCLAEVGRYQDALAAVEESVALYRNLRETNSTAHTADLASALISLDVRFGQVGRHQDALTACEEAVALWRIAAEADPAAHLPAFALALNNLGQCLAKVGRYRDALDPAAQSVTLWRALAGANPVGHLMR